MTNSASIGPVSNRTVELDSSNETDKTIGIFDGRNMRRRRNRDAVITALIDLIREGDLSPTVAKIADRAGVSHRSIFRYFDDLEDMARTAIETELRDAAPFATIPNAGEGTLEHRIDEIVKRQLTSLKRLHALGRVARSRSIQLPEIDRTLSMIIKFHRDQIMRHFAPELDAMDGERRQAITSAVLIMVGFDSYDMQVRVLGFEHDEIESAWRISLQSLLR
jgi:TetR/AcrR family transcriptional regulator of autoinduction and epiphytic fitness